MTTLRQALTVDLRLNSDRFAGSMIACVICLLLAALWSDYVASLLPLWAALAWYRYGRADTVEREELRASLGLSRADRVRGRVALIAVETAALLLTTVLATLLVVALGRESTGVLPAPLDSATSWLAGLGTVLMGTSVTLVALLGTAIGAGKECTTRRPGRGMVAASLMIYLLVNLLVSTAVRLPLGLLSRSGAGELWTLVVAAAVTAVLMGLLALWLWKRVQVWIRLLDSGAPQR